MTAYLVAVLIVVLIYLLLSLGLTIQYGLTGLINFGLVGFFAIGAYVSALLAIGGLPLPAAFLVASLVAGLAAWPIGLVALRLRDDYFAIVTLGFSETVRLVIANESWLTNGVRGVTGVPGLFQSAGAWAPFATALTLIILNAAIILILQRLVRSPFGRALEAVRDDETALTALGKRPDRFKIEVLILGSALAGLAGAFYGHYVTYIVPDQFVPLTTFYIWMAIIIGGVGRISGAVVGTVLLIGLLEGSRFLRDLIPAIPAAEMASVRIGVVGLLLILFLIYRPQGLLGDYTRR
jgi:branched-chain amino acid transport system permease protein